MIMTIFNIGDVVVPTEDGIKRYAFLITSGRYKVLQATLQVSLIFRMSNPVQK